MTMQEPESRSQNPEGEKKVKKLLILLNAFGQPLVFLGHRESAVNPSCHAEAEGRGILLLLVNLAFQVGLEPKSAVPTRIRVAPSSMATSKSWLIPIESSVKSSGLEACCRS